MSEAEHGLSSAYLFLGDDQLKIAALSKRLLQRLQQDGDVYFDSQVFDGSQPLNRAQLLDALNTPPLASPFRLITIQSADKLNSEISTALCDYLQKPLATTVLVLIAAKMTKESRLYKAVLAINPKAVIDSYSKKRAALPPLVRRLAQDYGLNISHEAVWELLELIGDSTVALNSEVRKLASYAQALGKSEIGRKDVKAVVARVNNYSAWDFVDAFASRDLERCIALLNAMTDQSPLGLLAFCVVRVREFLQVKALEARGSGSLEKELRRPQWQIRKLQESSAGFSTPQLRKILTRAAQTDMQMKSGADHQQAMLEFLLFAFRKSAAPDSGSAKMLA